MKHQETLPLIITRWVIVTMETASEVDSCSKCCDYLQTSVTLQNQIAYFYYLSKSETRIKDALLVSTT